MTRVGWGSLFLGALLLVVGWVLVWPALVILGAGSLSLVVIALLYLARRPRITMERDIQPPRTTKGTVAIAYLQLRNRSRLTFPPTHARQDVGPFAVDILLPKLRYGERGVRAVRLPTTKRGIYTVPPLEIRRADPFGFVSVVQEHAGTAEFWVYPRVFGLRPIPTGIARNIEGPTSDQAPQGTITFHRLREYVQGDDLRLIHWKSTARTGTLMVRHNVDTTQPYTVVVLDLRPDPYSSETFERALDAAASIIVASSVAKSPVRLQTSDGKGVGGPNHRDPQMLLDHLTALEPSTDGSLTAQLLRLRRDRGGTALAVVTGRIDPADLPAAAALRGRFQRVIVLSITPEPAPPIHFPGLTVVNATGEDDLVAAWNLGVAR